MSITHSYPTASYATPATGLPLALRLRSCPEGAMPPLKQRQALDKELDNRTHNSLLTALQRAPYEAWCAHLELVELTAGKALFESGSALEQVYFPTTAVVSLLYVAADGATTEVAVVGKEGMVGMCWVAGERALCRGVVQSSGYAYRLKARYLREAVSRGGVLPQLLMCYHNALFAQMAHTAMSGRHSSIIQMLCRWLLDRLDRSVANELKVTHEGIAAMLGVRRESITEAMGKLQSNGTIHCRRGAIAVLDRLGLERCAGRGYAYKPTALQYDRLLVEM